MYLKDKKCLCNETYYKPSSIGFCNPCVAPNCISCQYNKSSTCYQCADQNAYIENGICKCPSNKEFDDDGICQDIPEGCFKTVSTDITKCEICHYGFKLNSQEQCECEEDLTINTDNYCSACNVPGCKKCYSEQPNACAECAPAFNLINNLCKCPVTTEFPNEKDLCSACSVSNCIECKSDDPNTCLTFELPPVVEAVCDSPYCKKCESSGNDKLCMSCIDSKFLRNGQCLSCEVPGCETCFSPYTCQQCKFHTNLIDGICMCDGDMEKPTKTDSCSLCYSPGCGSCDGLFNCVYCQDKNAQLDKGECKCPSGTYLSHLGTC